MGTHAHVDFFPSSIQTDCKAMDKVLKESSVLQFT